MEHQKRSDDQKQLEEHSLPGINMAGKGPGDRECEEEPRENARAEGGLLSRMFKAMRGKEAK